ncbi:MAG TPA: type II secretion system protein GspL [Gammaproteobacteria bacterium]|nr:type II secretion system protein GspL [Gammaproteobacteria bacterium]
MSNPVFIRIPSETDQSVSCLVNTDEHGTQVSRVNQLDDCVVAKGHNVILLVPGNMVTLTSIAIPTRSHQRALKAIPYALEDQLASDVETLHFAHGDKSQDDAIPVAIIDQQRMQDWLRASDKLDIKLDAIIPDVLSLPLHEQGWSILIQGDIALVRTGPQSGFSFDCENLTQMLNLVLVETSGPKPELIYLYLADNLIPIGLLELFSEKEIECKQIHINENPIKLLQQSYRSNQSINLLQGDYRPQSRYLSLLKPWRTPLILVAIAILVEVLLMSVQNNSLNTQLSALQVQQTALFRATFPEIKRVQDPVLQMQQKLSQIRRTLGSRGHTFADLLASSVKALASSKGTQVTGIKFQKGTLELELTLKSLSHLDPVKEQLSKQNLNVDVLSANASGERVSARLRIRGNAS